MTSSEVDRWFAERKPPAETTLQRVREIILAADPRVTEYVKYGTVQFGFAGDMANFVQTKERRVNLMFNRGARISGEFPHLEGSGPSARFRTGTPVRFRRCRHQSRGLCALARPR
jgi:hypothetical protein